ncbi:MAG TPA: hypothetical protein VNO50_13790 [Pyrinomonadaceae bacterium]|nr:hypothetical protein [Pyrinomonadaceae bacterium]
MFTIRKAISEDFERVYPLFRGFGGEPIPRENWKKIFVSPWKSTEDFCGYLLLKDEEVKGYLGLIFSQRIQNSKVEKFCNMTTWVVNEDSRSHSLPMLLEALRLKDYTFTNFTASPAVATILGKLGFADFPVHQRVLIPIPRLAGRGVGCEFDSPVIRSKLSEADRTIFDDHQSLDCIHLLLQSKSGDCYVVLKKAKRRKITFVKVHYLSDADVFSESVESLLARICFRLRVFGLMVDERYIGERDFSASLKYPHQRRAYFKSRSIVGSNSIDTLYSEVVILHD